MCNDCFFQIGAGQGGHDFIVFWRIQEILDRYKSCIRCFLLGPILQFFLGYDQRVGCIRQIIDGAVGDVLR